MARVDLRIIRGDHPPALAIGHRVAAIRLVADISIATDTGWTLFEPAVVDTGAPVSVLPPAMWKQARFRTMGRVKIGGLARSEACQLPAILAEVESVLSDGKRLLGPIQMPAYLVEVENAPRLIGIQGFIERGTLHVDLSKDKAFLRLA